MVVDELEKEEEIEREKAEWEAELNDESVAEYRAEEELHDNWFSLWPSDVPYDCCHGEKDLPYPFYTAFRIAAMRGEVDALKEIIDKTPRYDFLFTEFGESLLYIAAKSGRTAMVDFLLNYDDGFVFIDTVQTDKKSPLWAALYRSHLPVVKLLLFHGAKYKSDEMGEFAPIDWVSDVPSVAWGMKKWLLDAKISPDKFLGFKQETLDDWSEAIAKIDDESPIRCPAKTSSCEYPSDDAFDRFLFEQRKQMLQKEKEKAEQALSSRLFRLVYEEIPDCYFDVLSNMAQETGVLAQRNCKGQKKPRNENTELLTNQYADEIADLKKQNADLQSRICEPDEEHADEIADLRKQLLDLQSKKSHLEKNIELLEKQHADEVAGRKRQNTNMQSEVSETASVQVMENAGSKRPRTRSAFEPVKNDPFDGTCDALTKSV